MAVIAPGSSGGGRGGGDDWRDDDWGRGKKGGWSDWWTHPKQEEEEEEEDSEQGDGSWWSNKGWSWNKKRRDNKGAVHSRMQRQLRRKHQMLLNEARIRLGTPVSGRPLSEQIAYEGYVKAHAEMAQLAQMQALAERCSNERRNLFPVEERAYTAMFNFVYGQGPPFLAGKAPATGPPPQKAQAAAPRPAAPPNTAYTAGPVPDAPVAPVAPPAGDPVRFTTSVLPKQCSGLIIKQNAAAPLRPPEPAKAPSFMSQLATGPLQLPPGKAASAGLVLQKAASQPPPALKSAGPPIFPKGTLSICKQVPPIAPKPKAASPDLATFHVLIDLQQQAKAARSNIASTALSGGSSSSSSAKAVGSVATPDAPEPKSLTPNIMSKAEIEKLKPKKET